MSEVPRKILGFFSKIFVLPVYAVTWVLGSPYLMSLLCIMSEVLVELVVSAVMAGVSLVVSAVILMEDDNRPFMPDQPLSLSKCIEGVGGDGGGRGSDGVQVKSTSTRSLENVLEDELEKEKSVEENEFVNEQDPYKEGSTMNNMSKDAIPIESTSKEVSPPGSPKREGSSPLGSPRKELSPLGSPKREGSSPLGSPKKELSAEKQ